MRWFSPSVINPGVTVRSFLIFCTTPGTMVLTELGEQPLSRSSVCLRPQRHRLEVVIGESSLAGQPCLQSTKHLRQRTGVSVVGESSLAGQPCLYSTKHLRQRTRVSVVGESSLAGQPCLHSTKHLRQRTRVSAVCLSSSATAES